ncbi:hypothetical protein TNIN_189621 [Trichonephila inaurata madagascariensis]|uniref:Uncharacterized protein n=1 Tax=Trichonephila inaurata madagascariensis TaxID=2747483 RepID=A0A8X6J904_9ARAC|nr:hypothetical protein TNIN_189621 [Trichonephila inaurata madagascariensis]
MAHLLPEYKFIRDVIRYVLSEYWPGTHWTPSGMFLVQDSDSPFTPVVQEIIKTILDDNAVDFHRCYDEYFPDKNITPNQHYELCIDKSESLIDGEYEDVIYVFIFMCACLSLFTALSVLYGVDAALIVTHWVILRYFESLKYANVITDSFWDDFQSACSHC